MTDRLPVTKRADNACPMRLTKRDRDIVVAVYTHRVLTRRQIKRLIFEKPGAKPSSVEYISKRRPRLLYDHGYLDRRRVPVFDKPTSGALPFAYFLDKRGADLIAQVLEIDREDVDWKPKDNKIKPLFLDHTLKLNDVRIAVELAASASGYQLMCWVDERSLRSLRERVPDPANPSRTLPLNPDGFFALDLGDRKAMLFVELDQATMTRSRFAKKVRAYQSYRAMGKSWERFKTQNFRVLTVTTGEKRVANLVEATHKAGGDDHFWFTTFDRVKPDTVLTSAIWQVVRKAGVYPLLS